MPSSTLIALSLALLSVAPSRASSPIDGPNRGADDAPNGSPSDDPIAAFEAWTGARLAFTRKTTPPQVLYATTPTLSPERRRDAARILLEHAHHYPKGALARMGLTTVAVFDGCGDPEGDGFRPWVDALNGYRYFGRWHEVGAIAACYYEDGQLPLTFHHEVFHHVDATRAGRTDYRFFTEDDEAFADAIARRAPYPALGFDDATIAALREAADGDVLEETVCDYAQKSAGEDQAETARWLQVHLADGLLQAATRPELAGSQRILHLLAEYEKALPTLTPAWFASVALGVGEAQRRPVADADDVRGEVREPGDNAYLAKVDEEIDDPALRRAIRRVQPATVRIGNGSGVNIAPDGLILTAGHVTDAVGNVFTVTFPDGRRFKGDCIASDAFLDLGLVRLRDVPDVREGRLPFARMADAPPEVGDAVVVIGQPGSRTPSGELTHYEPWHVSVGEIRGFMPNLLGKQSLGRTKHDAWTYWGHSGSPLFDTRGHIVALHNSWDSRTAMRHAVPWQAIEKFLGEHDGR